MSNTAVRESGTRGIADSGDATTQKDGSVRKKEVRGRLNQYEQFRVKKNDFFKEE